MQTATQNKPRVTVHVRWLIRKDMEAVQRIESECFEFPWCEEDFIRCLRQRNCIGMVATVGDRVVGFMIYELHKEKLHVLDFAVDPDCRYKSVGRQMIQRLTSKLSSDRRTKVVLEVRETNLDGQLFFKRLGFRCVNVLREYYEDCADCAYQFVYRHREGQ